MSTSVKRIRHATSKPLFAVLLMAVSGQAQNLFVGVNSDTVVNSSSITEIARNGASRTFSLGNYPLSDIAFDRSGNLFVTTGGPTGAGGKVYEYRPNGARTLFGVSKKGNLGTIAIDSLGDVFVCNSAINTTGEIYKFTPEGRFSVFASGLFDPMDIAFDRNGNLFAVDIGNGNIYEFINRGGVLRSKPMLFASGLQMPTALAFDAAGNLFVADVGAHNIYEYTRNGIRSTFESGLHEVGALVFDRAGNLFAGDGDGNIYEFTREGAQITFASGFNEPFALAFAPGW